VTRTQKAIKAAATVEELDAIKLRMDGYNMSANNRSRTLDLMAIRRDSGKARKLKR
jgi:hypothetical protein